MRTIDAATRDRRAWLAVAFIVPVLIIFAAYTVVTNTVPDEKFSAITLRSIEFREDDMFSGISSDLNEAVIIKGALSSDNVTVRSSAIRSLLTEHMSIVFVIGMLLGPSVATGLFKIFYFLRFGLSGASFFYFVRKNIGLKNDPSLLISTVYSVASIVVFGASLNTSLMNGLIVMPLLLSAVDTLNRKGGIRNVLISVALFAFTAASGFGGFVNCVPFCILFGIFMLLCDRKKQAKHIGYGIVRLFLTALIGTLSASVAVFPMIYSLRPVANVAKLFKEGQIRFFMFDFLYRMLDGNISGVSLKEGAPVLGISVLAIMLTVIFFANKEIPLRAKLFSGILMLILYLSVAYSALDEIFCLGKGTGLLTYSRLLCLMCLIVTLSAISLRNISCHVKGTVYLAAFMIIGLIIIESSSASEISPNTVSRLFSALCAVFWCAVFSHMITKEKELPTSVITVALFGLCFNVIFCMGPAKFAVGETGVLPSQKSDSNSSYEIRLNGDEPIPIFGDDNETYLVLSSSVEDSIADADIAQMINIISRSATADNVFGEIYSESYYFKDMYDAGAGKYGVEEAETQNEITIHAQLLGDYSRYYVVSMFQGEQHITEAYSDKDINSSFYGPFMMELTPSDTDVYIKLSILDPGNRASALRIYFLNEDALSALRSKVGAINNGVMDLSREPLLAESGPKTVITSIPYDESYRIRYEKDGKTFSADTVNLGGKLAFTVNGDSVNDLVVRVSYSSEDITVGITITLFLTVCIILCALMYNKNTRVDKENNNLAEQKD